MWTTPKLINYNVDYCALYVTPLEHYKYPKTPQLMLSLSPMPKTTCLINELKNNNIVHNTL